MSINSDLIIQGVYYVEAEDSRLNLDPIAIRPHIKDGANVEWEIPSPSRGGMTFKTSKITLDPPDSQTPEKIIVDTERKGKLELVRLTLKIYDEKVRNQLSGQPTFNSEEDLKEFFLETDFHSY